MQTISFYLLCDRSSVTGFLQNKMSRHLKHICTQLNSYLVTFCLVFTVYYKTAISYVFIKTSISKRSINTWVKMETNGLETKLYRCLCWSFQLFIFNVIRTKRLIQKHRREYVSMSLTPLLSQGQSALCSWFLASLFSMGQMCPHKKTWTMKQKSMQTNK